MYVCPKHGFVHTYRVSAWNSRTKYDFFDTLDSGGPRTGEVTRGTSAKLVGDSLSHAADNNNVVFIKRWFQDGTNITYGYLTLAHKR